MAVLLFHKSVHKNLGVSDNVWYSRPTFWINHSFLLYRESHYHPLEDCSPIHMATWQHQLSLPVLQPLHWPETTVSAALGLGYDSALIRSPPLSPQAKAYLQADHLAVQIHNLSCPNQGAERQVQCLTITVTKARPRGRLLRQRTLIKVLQMNCRRHIIQLQDLTNHLLHNRLSSVLLFILHMMDTGRWTQTSSWSCTQ